MRRLSGFLETLALVFLAGILLTVCLQVFFRYLAGLAVSWTEEATRYLGIWMVFMGAAAAVAQDSHIAVTVVVERLPPPLRRLLSRFSSLLMLLFSLLIFLGSLQLIRLNWEQQAVTFPVTVATLYLAVAVLAAISLPVLLVRLWRGKEGGQ
jgi:TRAP-type C4-dicarboxylate transport system permease small subunit